MDDKNKRSDSHWREILDAETYYVTREKGTELPFSGRYNDHYEHGRYHCVCCDGELFLSDTKFDAGCGWPSFSAPAAQEAISEHVDASHGMVRTEITCSHCGAHLGHVFEDGPQPTGLRYCVNSLSLRFSDDKEGR